jgi:hypothetical protein
VQREGFIAIMRHLIEKPVMAIFIDESNKVRQLRGSMGDRNRIASSF